MNSGGILILRQTNLTKQLRILCLNIKIVLLRVAWSVSKIARLQHKLDYAELLFLGIDLGPVGQSIVNLTSSLRGQLVKCFTTL